jgi:hypothetical protein
MSGDALKGQVPGLLLIVEFGGPVVKLSSQGATGGLKN